MKTNMGTRRIYNWQCRERTVVLGERTLIMGILNTTPDSFSDGGSYSSCSEAVDRAFEMAQQGADIIDIGGESTRPGAATVGIDEEISRTVPVIKAIREHSDVLISIDTMKSEVARQALLAGADIINDVSGFEADDGMFGVASEFSAGTVLMHMKGTPRTMQNNPEYCDVVREVGDYLESRAKLAVQKGLASNQIVVDPGIGFGKTGTHNLALLRGLPDLAAVNLPLLVGASRKSFIGQVLNRDDPSRRIAGSLGVAAWACMHGAHILRVHDVIETCDVCRMLDSLSSGELDAME